MPDERFDSYEKLIDSFIAIIDDIDFSLIFLAISIIFISKSYSGKTLLTKPTLSASWASMYLPVKCMSIALYLPTDLGSL